MVCRARCCCARCDKNLLRRRARFCDRDEQCVPAFEVLILGKQVQGEKELHAPVAPISGLFPKRIEPSIQLHGIRRRSDSSTSKEFEKPATTGPKLCSIWQLSFSRRLKASFSIFQRVCPQSTTVGSRSNGSDILFSSLRPGVL